jgi:hypothetical protein
MAGPERGVRGGQDLRGEGERINSNAQAEDAALCTVEGPG